MFTAALEAQIGAYAEAFDAFQQEHRLPLEWFRAGKLHKVAL